MFKYGVFSSPYFPVFGLNTEIYRSKSGFFLENTDQKKLRIWALFTQWRFHWILLTNLVCHRKNFPEEIFLGGSFPGQYLWRQISCGVNFLDVILQGAIFSRPVFQGFFSWGHFSGHLQIKLSFKDASKMNRVKISEIVF